MLSFQTTMTGPSFRKESGVRLNWCVLDVVSSPVLLGAAAAAEVAAAEKTKRAEDLAEGAEREHPASDIRT